MRDKAQRGGRLLDGLKLRSYFSPYVDQSTPNFKIHQISPFFTFKHVQEKSQLAMPFSFDDILLRSGDICDQVEKLS